LPRSREATSPDFGLVGSPAIGARVYCKPSKAPER
jgi:hypothetical protein